MRHELKLITEDTSYTGKTYQPRYKDQKGNPLHGIYRREDTKNVEFLYINAGHLMRKYKLSSEDEKNILFNSPMVSLENLHFSGGWSWRSGSWDNAALLNRVINRKKPAAFLLGSQEEIQKLEIEAKTQNLKTHIGPGGWNNEYHELGICLPGTFGSLFDMDAFEKTWMALTSQKFATPPCDHEWFVNLSNDNLDSYLPGFDYDNPKSVKDLILNGLYLGYAIETTQSILSYE